MRRSKSIRVKVLGCLLAISILPVIILFSYTLRNMTQFYHAQISAAANSEVRAVTTRINGIYDNLNNVMTALIFSEYDGRNCMQHISSDEAEGSVLSAGRRLTNNRMFEYVCRNLIGTNQYAEGVYLFNESGNTYSFVKNRELWLDQEYRLEDWERMLKERDSLQMTMMYLPKSFPEDQQKIVIARKFTDIKGKHAAVLALVCNDSMFDNMQDNTLPWGKTFVMGSDGTVLSGENLAVTLNANEVQEIIGNETGVIMGSRGKDAYLYGTLDMEGWKIVNEVSFESVTEVYSQSTYYLIAIIAAIILIILVLVVVSQRLMLEPIVSLAGSMSKTADNNMKFENKYQNREDEIGVLYRCYGDMLGQINRLIEEKYVGEIRYLQSRLQNLMSQINAHFIFNTLENINCLAQIDSNRQISTMSKSLGDMLRYSMEYEQDEETLITEIEHIRKYINIQEIRFDNEITLALAVEESLYDAKVLKFMLQPVVENAIEHGLASGPLPWIITIGAVCEDGVLAVSVSDNGSGMGEAELERVRAHIGQAGSGGIADASGAPEVKSEDSRYRSIGLSNIHKRIQLLYGTKYGLFIKGERGRGVVVTMKLPFGH